QENKHLRIVKTQILPESYEDLSHNRLYVQCETAEDLHFLLPALHLLPLIGEAFHIFGLPPEALYLDYLSLVAVKKEFSHAVLSNSPGFCQSTQSRCP